MKRRTSFFLQTGALSLFLFLVCKEANAGTSVLLRSGSQSGPEVTGVQTYSGRVDLQIAPVKPATPLTVVLLLDGLSTAAQEDVSKDLLALYGGLNGRPMRLVLLRNGGVAQAGPFASRVRFKSALEKIEPADASAPPISAAAFYDAIGANASEWGANWSRVLLVGDFPPLEQTGKEYAEALLLRAFGSQRLQVSWYAPGGGDESWLPVFGATGGALVRGGLTEYLTFLNDAGQYSFEVHWTAAVPPNGFVVSHSIVADATGHAVVEAREVAALEGTPLPTVEQYLAAQARVAEAKELLKQDVLSEESEGKIREDLRAALEMNYRDPESLLTASRYNEKRKDYAAAARFRTTLTEVRPLDTEAFAGLGHVLLLGSEWEKAEEALKHASELNGMTLPVAEDLARVRLAVKDDKGALPYLHEALKGDARRQDLWFLQAHAAEGSGEKPLAVQSFEQGLALGGVHVAESGELLRLYMGEKQNEKAQKYEQTLVAGLPEDAGIRAEYAEMLDNLQRSDAALSAWRRVLEVQPGFDRAHYRIARLLLELGDAQAAERAANAGLGVAPKYAGLYIVRAEALEKQGRTYDAREALEQGASAAQDRTLLAKWAIVQDTFGAAGESYARLAEAMGATAPERLPTLERGFAVSLRDADFKQARSFAEMLKAEGHPEFQSLLSVQEQKSSGVLIPGGLDALAFAAHGKEGVAPEKFFLEYSRMLISQYCETDKCGFAKYVEEIQDHFRRIAALEALGKREDNRVVITLSLSGKEPRKNTEKVLNLLGMKLRNSNGHVELDRGENKAQAKKQETTSALAIDELGMAEALQSGKTFALEIPDEWVAIYPDEPMWREVSSFSEAPGGFAVALARNPKLAHLYVGINSMDKQTVIALTGAVSLKTLLEKHADEVYLFAAAFALQSGHAVVPGGPQAEAIWSNLVGENPARPGGFFRALLERDEGRLLAYFFVMSQLDQPHQAFFTINFQRTSQFYKLFAESDEIRAGFSRFMKESTFTEFFRSVPLDGEGHVDFPGSGEVWTVAKGHSSGEPQTAKMMKKVSKAVAPEVEDELLLRLAKTRYREKVVRHTELENFLAVARLDAHRDKPLNEESALLLAQSYTEFSSAYPYFTDITELSAADYRQFFNAVERIKAHNALEANLQLGQLHALIEWICLLRQRGVIDSAEATKLFQNVVIRFAAAESGSSYAAASVEAARIILADCKSEKAVTADEKMRTCFLGAEAQPGSRRSTEFQRVLEIQKAPSLDSVFSLFDGAAKDSIKGARDVAALEKTTNALPVVELPRTMKIQSKEKESIVRYDTAPLHKAVGQLAQKMAKSKVNAKDIEKLSEELLAGLQPQVALALAGPLYAYFLRPADLVVSEDALLLRKHHYFRFDSDADAERKQLLPESSFYADSQGAGSYFVGGFAQFGLASGDAAAKNWKTSGPAGAEAIAADIAAIRETSWDRLEESDQRLVGLRTTVAREWIAESARRPAEFTALSEETMGILSLTRRADLLTGIEARNWRKVWDSVTLPDLFTLGGRYLGRFKTDPWTSPSTEALRALARKNDGARLYLLGAVTYHSFGCSHPHLMTDAPYEEYERHMMPADIAERTAEFKLYLAYQADRMGLPPRALDRVAEPLAAKAFRNTKMTDYKDWRALMAGYASITTKDLKQALEQ